MLLILSKLPHLKARGLPKIASVLGSILEWYDFALYTFFASTITKLFFPTTSSHLNLLKTFSIFAVGFIARPFGALLFGYIGDKYGRAISLKITPILITLPTLAFAFLPTYQEIGILAPVILILLRIGQGICIGGEFSNNIIYLCESSKKGKTYFLGSIGASSGSIGILLASLMATLFYQLFTQENFIIWGWRLAFSSSFFLGILTYLLRKKMPETPVFTDLKKQNLALKNPISLSIKKDMKNYLVGIGLTFFPATAFYYVFMFLPNFLTEILKLDARNMTSDSAWSLLMRLFFIPLVGLAADKFTGIKISRVACIACLILAYPLFFKMIHGISSPHFIFLCFAMLTTLNAGTTPGLLMNVSKSNTRCTVFSFCFNVSFGVFGGITPLICFFVTESSKNLIASIYYLMFAAFITFFTTFFFKKGNKDDSSFVFTDSYKNNQASFS